MAMQRKTPIMRECDNKDFASFSTLDGD